jgi:maltose 6'-phosphate phosphatase
MAGPRCDDVADRGHLNLVSLNLLFSELAERDTRLAVVADGMAAMAQAGEPVDALLLQEVIGGPLAGTLNSGQDLRAMLSLRGLDYDLAYFKVNGTPRVAEVGNAVLTRCEITARTDVILPPAVERVLPDLNVPLRRAVSLTRLRLPSLGEVNVYNTHLCAYCSVDERMRQAQTMLSAMESIEAGLAGKATLGIVLGGDFNTNLEVPAERPVYELITATYGFRDAYADLHRCESCCSANVGYEGCTFGRPGNPFAVDIFSGEIATPQRIDYFFWHAPSGAVADARVVPDSGYWVSDHSPVLLRLALEP